MFNPNGGYYELPGNLDEIVSFKNGSQSASSAKNICNGVQCLIRCYKLMVKFPSESKNIIAKKTLH